MTKKTPLTTAEIEHTRATANFGEALTQDEVLALCDSHEHLRARAEVLDKAVALINDPNYDGGYDSTDIEEVMALIYEQAAKDHPNPPHPHGCECAECTTKRNKTKLRHQKHKLLSASAKSVELRQAAASAEAKVAGGDVEHDELERSIAELEATLAKGGAP